MKEKNNSFDAAITSIVNSVMEKNKDSIISAYSEGKAILVDPYSGTIKAVDIYKTLEELENEN